MQHSITAHIDDSVETASIPVQPKGPSSSHDFQQLTPSLPTVHIELETRFDSLILIRVTGEVDILGAPVLAKHITEVFDAHRGLVIDMNGVEFLSTQGLATLLEAHDRAEREHREWALVATCLPVTRPLLATDLVGEMPLYTSVNAGLAAVHKAMRSYAAG